VAAILWLNLYLCRQAFFIESSGYANAMHGFWMALARVPVRDWILPTWWRYWDGGMPLEFTYPPLVPWLIRAISLAGGTPVSHAFHILAAVVFCLIPVILFWTCRRMSGSIAFSFLAALLYSLWSPTELAAPDARFGWSHVGDARRMYLTFVWDELPHHIAVGLFLVALANWVRMFKKPSSNEALRPGSPGKLGSNVQKGLGRTWALAVLAAAGAVLANAFGATLLAVGLVCLLLARPRAEWRTGVRAIGTAAIVAYLLISPWLPPSLIQTITRNSNLYPEGAWTSDSVKALALVAAGWVVVAWLVRRFLQDWFLRFWLQLAYILTAVVAVHHHLGWHFLPQSGRYKVEMELAVSVAVAFALWRLPKPVLAVLLLVLLPVGVRQVISHRRYSKVIVRSVPADSMFESRMARRLEADRYGPRVFAPGSLAMWLNYFAPDIEQFGGGSFPTALNPVQQAAIQAIHAGERTEYWLRSFAGGTFVVSGKEGGEFWKPFRAPEAFEGQFPVLWLEPGTAVYQVPSAPRSLASVDGGTAGFTWQSSNRAAVYGDVPPDRRISVKINYHPGWRASGAARILRDPHGVMILETRRSGPQTIELRYTGGWEGIATRMLMLAAIGIIARIWNRG
jgi:hypothetical protein